MGDQIIKSMQKHILKSDQVGVFPPITISVSICGTWVLYYANLSFKISEPWYQNQVGGGGVEIRFMTSCM